MRIDPDGRPGAARAAQDRRPGHQPLAGDDRTRMITAVVVMVKLRAAVMTS